MPESAEPCRANLLDMFAGHPSHRVPAVFSVMAELKHEITPPAVSAIMFRMQALGRIIEDHSAEIWALEIKGKREIFVQQAVYEATAKARLDFSGDQPEFDRDEFFSLVLRFSDSEGRA